MKSYIYSFILILSLLAGSFEASSRELVLLHTNDTHSQITPDSDGFGGVLRRKAVIDSVRAAHDNVLLIDAGDAVQGTLYFTLFGGEVETKAMNALGYDLAILGNHDFDNGMEALAKNIKNSTATWITTNYDTRNTPLDSLLVPYVIKDIDGRRIAFMGINLNPEGMISSRNYRGLGFEDIYKAANSTAWCLKNLDRADLVVAITHIGYNDKELPDDVKLAAQSEDIDIIIGGHSHTVVDPSAPNGLPYIIKNAVGRDVLVTQTGRQGKNVGEIVIDLDNLTPDYRLIPIDSRLDDRLDPETAEVLQPYRAGVDSLMNLKVTSATADFDKHSLSNLLSDIVLERGKFLAGKGVDLGIINRGGIRNIFHAGDISEGRIIMTLPFDNRVEVIELSGADLQRTIEKMAERGISGVSSNVEAVYDPEANRCTEIIINGSPIDPERIYRLATIDYLANGGDYLVWLRDCTKLATSNQVLYRDVINILRNTPAPLTPDNTDRIRFLKR